MATNKMLIDASHPEETRVAVVRGNRIEEFDFESLEKQQLRGNIYLAKVTRVEPSLQAAFVDYGGNRHGFLAFSEIHPDYYQIPIADRLALLEEEAADARASRAREDKEDLDDGQESEQTVADASSDETAADSDDVKEEKPKKARRPRRRTKKAAAEETEANTDSKEEASSEDVTALKAETAENVDQADSGQEVTAEASDEPAIEEDASQQDSDNDTVTVDEPAEETEEVVAAAQLDADDADKDEDPDGPPKTMAAENESDSVSEPAPEAKDGSGDESDADGAGDEPVAEAKTAKKSRRTTRRKPKEKEQEAEPEAADASALAGQEEEPATEEISEGTESGDDEAVSASDDDDSKEATKSTKSKRKRSTRRKRSGGDARAADDNENHDGKSGKTNGDHDDNGSDEEDDVESVGQEDALEEVPERYKSRRQYKIQEVIKRRQVLLVQVVKEERGNKGAALTTYLSLAGRYSVLMPNTARGGGISRKITNSADRKRLKSIASELDVPEGMGVILRTAGAARTKAEINRDFDYLMRLWEKVRNLTLSSSAPCLVYEEGSLIKRSIRDLYNKDIGEILVAGEAGYQEARDFMGMLMPSHVRNVKPYNDTQTIFTRYGVEAQLDRMVTPQVTLKSGGYLVMNQTEALVAIDVNSGRSTREHSIEDTALQTNLEAAEEVARQLRLRDLAGLIVIDFIDMEEKRNNRAVEKRLKDCLKNDRARIQVGRISHFGLLEMSRQRIRASVLESTMDTCKHCQGMGYVRSDSAIALHVFRSIEEHLGKHSRFDIVVKTTPSIGYYILNHKRVALLDLENRYGLKISIEGDHNIVGQEFTIEKGEIARGTPADSHKLIYDGAMPSDEEEDSAPEATDVRDEEDNGDRKKRRRRRRGKRRGGYEEGSDEVSADSGNDNSADDVSGDEEQGLDASAGDVELDDDNEEMPSRSKSRRGKRGGKRKKLASQRDAETDKDAPADGSEPTSKMEEVASPASEEPSVSVDSDGEAEESAAQRTRRSTRRPRKPKPQVEEAATETADQPNEESPAAVDDDEGVQASEETTARAGAPAKPERQKRSTRRPKETGR